VVRHKLVGRIVDAYAQYDAEESTRGPQRSAGRRRRRPTQPVSIEVANESGVEVDEQALVQVARHVLDRLGVSPLAELSLLLVDVEQMEKLPRALDGRARPDRRPRLPDGRARPARLARRRARQRLRRRRAGRDRSGVLGDVVLCPEVAERQGARPGTGTAAELELLCTHGVLHLLGYDHGDPEEHAEMFGLQGELLSSWKAAQA
jgi:probable rRNA maturation factor